MELDLGVDMELDLGVDSRMDKCLGRAGKSFGYMDYGFVDDDTCVCYGVDVGNWKRNDD